MRTAVLHWDWLQQLFIHNRSYPFHSHRLPPHRSRVTLCSVALMSHTELLHKNLDVLLLCGQQLWRCHLCLQPPLVIRDWASVYCARSSWWAQSTFLSWIQTTSSHQLSHIIPMSGGHFTHDVNCSLSGKLEAASCSCYTGQILWIVISCYWYR